MAINDFTIIGVIGLGVVGSAVYHGLKNYGNVVYGYDIADENTSFENILQTDIVYICVPTETVDNRCDTSIVESVVAKLYNCNYKGIIAIKSTVIPGTTKALQEKYPRSNLCFVPEFLRAKSAYEDFLNQKVLIVGTEFAFIEKFVQINHRKNDLTCIRVSPTEAEIIKYISNVHNAMDIVFANIMFEFSKATDANYENVYKGLHALPWISVSYLKCDEKTFRGFGGHCLPKDTTALNTKLKDSGLNFKLIDAILEDNKKFI